MRKVNERRPFVRLAEHVYTVHPHAPALNPSGADAIGVHAFGLEPCVQNMYPSFSSPHLHAQGFAQHARNCLCAVFLSVVRGCENAVVGCGGEVAR